MSPKFRHLLTVAIAAASLAALLPDAGGLVSGHLVARAEAVVGRPATPMSYAGVARRTTRRAVVASPTVIVAPAPVVVVAPRPGCFQAVDAYGHTYWRCP